MGFTLADYVEEKTYGHPNFLCSLFECKTSKPTMEDEHTGFYECSRCKSRDYFFHFQMKLSDLR